ncbi:hypothetical protein [Thermospira aquatica]|uniref:Double Cache domain-containing protein n=1 Tax=Thermospira aquatica TaxID=2828656 RepID=A0AAX3BD73_9SPIR|nr:hypothetical protein [Thermospira aquatica]URA09969.1 hypothetical protein KDW03_10885 [Thermospira aquatica]
MQAKKIVLFMSFVLVVILLFVVVFMAKNQIGNFGKDYDRYVTKKVESYATWFTNRREEIAREVKGLASDKLVTDLIVALYSGEDITSYNTQFESILSKLSQAKKIQLLDPDGIVIYSTQPGEALVNRFVPTILTQLQNYQQSYQQPYLRFLSTNEFFVANNFQSQDKTFQLVVYYDTKRFAHPDFGLMIPWGKTIVVARQTKGKEDAARIVEQASLDPSVLSRGKKTIGGMKEVDGIQLLYFARYDRYLSGWVIGILVFAFVLLFLILYAFYRLLQEEKIYKEPLTFRHAPREDLKTLVEDIEEGETVTAEEAKKGIEEMLMSDHIEDLTSSSAFVFERPSEQNKEETKEETMVETPTFEEKEWQETPSFEEPSIEEPSMQGSSMAEFSETPETLSFGSEEPEISEPEILEIETPPSLSDMDTAAFEPDKATTFFSEQDRLMDELSPEMQEEVSLPSEEKPEEFSLEPSFLSAEESAAEPSVQESLILEPDFVGSENMTEESQRLSIESPESPEELPEVSFETASIEELSQSSDTSVLMEQPLEKIVPEETPSLELVQETISLEESNAETAEGSEEIVLPSLESEEQLSLETLDLPEVAEAPVLEEMTEDLSLADTLLEEVSPQEENSLAEDEVIALNMDELSNIPIAEENVQEVANIPEDQERVMENEPLAPPEESSSSEKVVMFGEKVHESLAKLLSEPPKRLSTIHDVPSYANAARDIAHSSLGMKKVCVLEKKGDVFENILHDGFQSVLTLSTKDPIYTKILSKHKSLDIQNNLEKASYLRKWFGDGELERLEELFITPVIKKDEVVGIGIYGREKGVPEVTDLQKSELYNIGFLQEVE